MAKTCRSIESFHLRVAANFLKIFIIQKELLKPKQSPRNFPPKSHTQAMFSVIELLLAAIAAYFRILSNIVVNIVVPSKSKWAVSNFRDADTAPVDLRAISTKKNSTYLVVGDRGSGKTAFINICKQSKINFIEIPAACPGRIASDAYKSAKAAIVVCYIANPESAEDWKNLVNWALPDIPVTLVATKMDLVTDIEGSKLDAMMQRISKEGGFNGWFAVSNTKIAASKKAAKINKKESVEAVEAKCKPTPQNGEMCNRRKARRTRMRSKPRLPRYMASTKSARGKRTQRYHS